MTDRTLSLAYGTDPFDLSTVDVKRCERTRLLGTEAVVHVIGSSHYVAVPDRDLYEFCSCEPLPDAAATVPLRTGHAQSVRFETPAAAVETVVETRPLASFPGPDAAAVAYRFGPDAYTTIDRTGDGYETYHTYPEYDLAVFTRSSVTERADVTAGQPAGDTAGQPVDDTAGQPAPPTGVRRGGGTGGSCASGREEAPGRSSTDLRAGDHQ